MDKLLEKICKVLFTTDFDNLTEAVLADIVDWIPVIGDVTNFSRLVYAIAKGDKNTVKVLQAIDFLGGVLPEVGDVVDLLTPSNIITYFIKKKGGR